MSVCDGEESPGVHVPLRKDATDVVVIGCGAGGGVIAKELGEAGLRVVVLEAGKRYDPSLDYPTDNNDFEVRARITFDPDDPGRDRYTTRGTEEFFFNRVKGVGGSTLHYVGVSPRFHESDFRVRSMDGVADNWPITYQDLEPYYAQVEYELGVSGPDGANANPFEAPRSKPFPTPPHEFTRASEIVMRGAQKLGLHLVREPLAIPTKEWHGRPACINAGACHLGCKISAKSSIDVTYVPKAESTGRVIVLARCLVREIKLGQEANVQSVVYVGAKGEEREIRARAFVVAANAIETPRLMLMSQSSRFPNGLANSSGLVGRYLCEHLAIFTTGLFSERLEAWRGVPTGGMIQDFYETSNKNSFARGWTVIVNSGNQWPLGVARRLQGWGADHRSLMKKKFGHFIELASVGEQLPDAQNQVALDPAVKDSCGLPVPQISFRLGENDRRMMKSISASQRNILDAAGATEITEKSYKPGESSHYSGTCRMGSDPKTSVVDAWCRAHDVPNLFIGDSSPFVTSAATNPALTISALASRTARGIIDSFRRGDL